MRISVDETSIQNLAATLYIRRKHTALHLHDDVNVGPYLQVTTVGEFLLTNVTGEPSTFTVLLQQTRL